MEYDSECELVTHWYTRRNDMGVGAISFANRSHQRQRKWNAIAAAQALCRATKCTTCHVVAYCRRSDVVKR